MVALLNSILLIFKNPATVLLILLQQHITTFKKSSASKYGVQGPSWWDPCLRLSSPTSLLLYSHQPIFCSPHPTVPPSLCLGSFFLLPSSSSAWRTHIHPLDSGQLSPSTQNPPTCLVSEQLQRMFIPLCSRVTMYHSLPLYSVGWISKGTFLTESWLCLENETCPKDSPQ